MTAERSFERPRMMICDDDPSLRGIIGHVAEGAGYEVVAELEVAPHLLASVAAVKPDLITLDLWLPGISGLDALREIRMISPDTRIVVFSAHDMWRENALELGAHHFVEKPDFDELERAMQANQLSMSS